MAYVAISRDLINRVEQKIEKMRRQELSGSCPNIANGREVALDVSALFTEGCWGKYSHLVQQMPVEDWCHRQERADIYVTGEELINEKPVSIRSGVRFTGLTNAWARPTRGYYGDSKCEFTIEIIRAMPEGTRGKEALLERYAEAITEAEINIRWTKIKSDVTEFLHKCKSLNEAIKLFPGIKMYVDKDDIERVERKIERAPRTDLVKSVDTGTITASAVAARLMGATS